MSCNSANADEVVRRDEEHEGEDRHDSALQQE
jgi:hypothetical protein